MKRKVVIHDNISNKVIHKEVELRDPDHFASQLKFKSKKYKDKSRYTRKQKYKKDCSEF